MREIFRAEIFKITRKVEYWLSFIIFIVPLILAFSIQYPKFGLDISFPPGVSTISRFYLMIVTLGFVTDLGVYHILFSVIATNTLSSEIDSNYFMLYLPRLKRKDNLYTVKSLVLSGALLIHILLYCIFSYLVSEIIITSNSLISQTFFDKYSFYCFANMIAMAFELICFANIALFTGLFFKPLQNILLSIGIFICSNIFYSTPIVKYIIPRYYTKSLAALPDMTEKGPISYNLIMVIIISFMYIIITNIVGRWRIRKM
ncbi:hypothetical protein Mahau_1951 [Mahella australiensis 50-1 BON]|jgi:ABC-2 type transport system permease protein|uniref:ABC-2 family transporter protein n=1 Tax=Mahella australiensis (strain DSM 15567 / CIP 107919 / 50-1 BON) TaxID=697281 RepID=F4A1S7_MAHA5|nr:hypothetical protein Mahau_1951 [Mahella australiensis 50-1 BON]